jgi:WASH complex subunit strumpellin
MLYVLLFFNCDIMDVKKSKMREIVDRHFYDSWVIPFYLSYYVDLTIEWNEFKAARKALENTLDLDYI